MLEMIRWEKKSINEVTILVNKLDGEASILAGKLNELINLSFSPGRGAIGYPVMYVLYRVLNEFKPTSILELGI